MTLEKIDYISTFNKRHCIYRHSPYDSLLTKDPFDVRVVAIGGGTGLPVVLRSLKALIFPENGKTFNMAKKDRLTAIVTVVDDGGSSGRIRREFKTLPPGDIRNSLVALSDEKIIFSNLFQYRFNKGKGLSGHSLGNLFLTALTELSGDFLEAIESCSEIMKVKGTVLPSTLQNVTLLAQMSNGNIIRGESKIALHKGRVRQVFLDPQEPEPLSDALDAIKKADAIILGPGSLYTSIIPNLLVKGIANAIRESKGKKIYICNIMTEPGETDGYTATDHIRAILDHVGSGIIEYIVLNKGSLGEGLRRYKERGSSPVKYNHKEIDALGIMPVTGFLSKDSVMIRHDEKRLGNLLMKLILQ